MNLLVRKILLFIAMLLIISGIALCIVFSVRNIDSHDKDVCESHIDENYDFICDLCENELEKSEPEPDPDPEPDPEPEPEPECVHKDENFDGKCEVCGEDISGALSLISDGKLLFNFVYADGISGDDMMAIDKLASELKSLGATVEVTSEKSGKPSEFEILFGGVTTRGEEYIVDSHAYGAKGYAVKVVGKKIAVVGGSKSSLLSAIDAFKADILGIDENTVDLSDRTASSANDIEVFQSDYKTSKITLFGKDMLGFKIAIDKKNADATTAATNLQTLFYEKCGYWFPIVDSSENHEKAIVISLVDKTGGDGLYGIFSEGLINIKVEYSTSLKTEIDKYFETVIDAASSTLEFDSSDNFVKNVRDVCYKDFGAVGDGVTNDAEAILAAHRYAYDGGHLKIVGESGKTYYIGQISNPAPIVCDVDWTGVKFIIDDTVIVPGTSTDIFEVKSAVSGSTSLYPSSNEEIRKINENGGIDAKSTSVLNLGLGYPAMIKVNNSSHKNYIRYGSNANSGEMQTELLLIDAEGNIDPTTPFMFDYEKITSINVYKIDEAPIVIEGGEFTTRAYAKKTSYYYSRGINITRSFVTVRNLEHYVVGEGEKGAPYSHFIKIQYCCNVSVEDSVFTAHKTYYNSDGTGIGTYDLNVDKCINVTFKNCTQTNFFNEDGSLTTEFWGVMASGQAKNITYYGCVLSRFDAHEGVWNATIKDSTIKHIRIVGGGTFTLENSHVYNSLVIGMREDYGAFWFGDIIIKDVTVHSNQTVTLFDGRWYNHDFGYKTALPTNITVDGLSIEGNASQIRLFSTTFASGLERSLKDEFTSTSASGEVTVNPNINKMQPTESLTIKNYGDINIILPIGEYFENMSVEFPGDFSELTYVAFGDSITKGTNLFIPSGLLDPSYPEEVKNLLNLKSFTNYGVAGADLCYVNKNFSSISNNVLNLTEHYDIISVNGGINDWNCDNELGTINDKTDTTIYGSLNLIAEYLTTNHSDSFYFFITPYNAKLKQGQYNGNTGYDKNKLGYSLEDVAIAYRQVGEKYNIPVLDLFKYGNYEVEMYDNDSDGVHPNQDFILEYTAPQIAEFIKNNYK